MEKATLILGGTGLIGSALTHILTERGKEVWILSRDKARHQERLHPARLFAGYAELPGVPGAIVNLAGAGIADEKWTPKRKELLRRSRIDTTQALIQWLQGLAEKPKVLIQGSALGYYGMNPRGPQTEESPAGQDFLGGLARDWEEAAKPAQEMGIRLCFLRTAMVLAKEGGALKKMIPPIKVFLGGPLGSGRQPVSWIHIEDELGILLHLLDHEHLQGPFNAVAPEVTDNRSFLSQLAQALHRPSWLPVPSLALKLLLGELSGLILQGQDAKADKILESGFDFQYPRLTQALNNLFTPDETP